MPSLSLVLSVAAAAALCTAAAPAGASTLEPMRGMPTDELPLVLAPSRDGSRGAVVFQRQTPTGVRYSVWGIVDVGMRSTRLGLPGQPGPNTVSVAAGGSTAMWRSSALWTATLNSATVRRAGGRDADALAVQLTSAGDIYATGTDRRRLLRLPAGARGFRPVREVFPSPVRSLARAPSSDSNLGLSPNGDAVAVCHSFPEEIVDLRAARASRTLIAVTEAGSNVVRFASGPAGFATSGGEGQTTRNCVATDDARGAAALVEKPIVKPSGVVPVSLVARVAGRAPYLVRRVATRDIANFNAVDAVAVPNEPRVVVMRTSTNGICQADRATIVNLVTRRVERSTARVCGETGRYRFSASGGLLALTPAIGPRSQAKTFAVIDTATARVRTLRLPAGPYSFGELAGFSQDEQRIIIHMHAAQGDFGDAWAVDLASGSLTNLTPPGTPAAGLVAGVQVSQDGSRAWVAARLQSGDGLVPMASVAGAGLGLTPWVLSTSS